MEKANSYQNGPLRICDVTDFIRNLKPFIAKHDEELKVRYKALLDNNEFYSFLLQIKTKVRKLVKDFVNQVDMIMEINYFCIACLSNSYQFEAIADYLRFFIEHVDKITVENEIFNLGLLDYFIYSFCQLPRKECKKSNLQLSIIDCLRIKGVMQESLRESKIFQIFTEDCLFSDDPIGAFKYALLSQDFSCIELLIDLHATQISVQHEEVAFIVRIILDLILSKNLKLAHEIFIRKGVSNEHNAIKSLENNPESIKAFSSGAHPLFNLSLVLLSNLTKFNETGHNQLKVLSLTYKNWIESEFNLKEHLHQISLLYYNKPLNLQPINFMSMLSNFLG